MIKSIYFHVIDEMSIVIFLVNHENKNECNCFLIGEGSGKWLERFTSSLASLLSPGNYLAYTVIGKRG